jgi:hypothetical protein
VRGLPLVRLLGVFVERRPDSLLGSEEHDAENQGRRLFAEYIHVTSGVRHKVYLLGIVDDSLNYAFVADAPFDDWDQNWPIIEAMLDSLRFDAK